VKIPCTGDGIMSNIEKICVVVVTFNRKELLLNCLNALFAQTRPVDTLYIIDNSSSDGTELMLHEKEYIKDLPPSKINEPWQTNLIKSSENEDNKGIVVSYVKMNENTGGAGGFHTGVERAYSEGHDWVWLMDDDGCPEENCLLELLKHKQGYNFLNPLVVNINDKTLLSFNFINQESKTKVSHVSDAKSIAKDYCISGVAMPFNGTFLSKKLISKIGFPKREMFIWGDEVEYFQRAKKSKLGIATIVSAVHYHPQGRVGTIHAFNKYTINYQTNKFKNYCDMRNKAFIQKTYMKKELLKSFVKYSLYFILHLRISDYLFYLNATRDGLLNKWDKTF
jgi:rhamnopyranosyl-N-acetylglucosaminyl-diphospho-decaprenol beta-1,3/1,4-galactofuranosyltransferase